MWHVILKVLTTHRKNIRFDVTNLKLKNKVCTTVCYSDKGAPVNVAGKTKVGYRADIIHTDHMEANNRIGCTRLQKISVTGRKIKTL